jgi:hypothetical protein
VGLRRSRFEDAPLRLILFACDALGVDPQKDVYGVSRPLGDLGRVSRGLEPGRHGGVSEVVGAARDERFGLGFGECRSSCLVEHLEVCAVSDDFASGVYKSGTQGRQTPRSTT